MHVRVRGICGRTRISESHSKEINYFLGMLKDTVNDMCVCVCVCVRGESKESNP